MTRLEDEAGWDRGAMIEDAVALAELGFGIIRVCHATPDDEWSCSMGRNHVDHATSQPCPAPGKRPIGDDWQHRAQHDDFERAKFIGHHARKNAKKSPR